MNNTVILTAEPVISTNVKACAYHEISFEWKIIAICNHKRMIWKWFMSKEEATKVRPAVDNGIMIMVQRRDADATVLLAKWAKMV